MKIILTKDIQLGKKGDTVSVSQPRGNYLIRMGVAKAHVEKVDKPKKKEHEKSKPGATNKGKGKS